jgi:hypothetical protein
MPYTLYWLFNGHWWASPNTLGIFAERLPFSPTVSYDKHQQGKEVNPSGGDTTRCRGGGDTCFSSPPGGATEGGHAVRTGFLVVIVAVLVLVCVLRMASNRRLCESSVPTKQQSYRWDEPLPSELLCQLLTLSGISLKSRGFSPLALPSTFFVVWIEQRRGCPR